MARHRRLVVAALLALAVAAGLQAVRPPRQPTDPVLVAARDLPIGHRLTARDLVTRAWPDAATPAGLLPTPVGRVLASPLRRGEPVTDVRVASTGRSTPAAGAPAGGTSLGASSSGSDGPATGGRLPPGWVAMTVRLTDPAAALLVAPGDRVQVIAGAPTDPLAAAAGSAGHGAPAAGGARVVVDDALVLTTGSPVPSAGKGSAGGGDGGSAGDGSAGGGLFGALGGGRSAAASEPTTDDPLPAGVIVLGLPASSAVDLAAASSGRYLTVARQIPVSN